MLDCVIIFLRALLPPLPLPPQILMKATVEKKRIGSTIELYRRMNEGVGSPIGQTDMGSVSTCVRIIQFISNSRVRHTLIIIIVAIGHSV